MAYEIRTVRGVDESILRIEGVCDVNGFRGKVDVIAFSIMKGTWTTASSMCLPSDIVAAIQIQECVAAAFDRLAEVEKLQGN